jgi:hypothetical protein
MLRDEIGELEKPGLRAAFIFCNRFRVPFPVFERVLLQTKQSLS